MKRFTLAFILVVITMLLCGFTSDEHDAASYSSASKDRVFKLVVPTHTTGTIKEDCSLRKGANIVSEKICAIKKGVVVEILKDSSEKWYLVEWADEEAIGWLNVKYLDIHNEQAFSIDDMGREDIEQFVNAMNFPSNSDFFIWTDIARQKTHVMEKKAGRYSLLKTMDCSTGKASTPTTRGFFIISDRGPWFYSRRFESGGAYWVRFNETYLFHSVAMDKDKNITDGILGERRSSGCVRLSVSDAKWIYDNIPHGTSVFIH